MVSIVSDILFLVALIVCLVPRAKPKEEVQSEDGFIEKHSKKMLVFLLFVSAIFLLFRITKVPYGLHVDEAGAFYDAISISKYGVDRYLYKLPVYFINFGGGQSALYTYLAAIIIKIFGASVFTFRFPSVILSILSILFLYRVISSNNGKREALFSCFILAVSPWFIMKSRWGLDAYLMCSMMTIAIAMFMDALTAEKRYKYILSGIIWGLTLYTYAISYLIVPAVLGISLIYALIIRKVKIKDIIYMAIPLGILAIPLMLMLAYNSGLLENVKIPIFSIPRLWFFRGGEINLKNVPGNIKPLLDMLFIKDFLNYNALEEFGTLYRLSIPLIIFGFLDSIRKVIKEIKEKEFSLDLIMILVFIATFILGLCVSELNINKINVIYIPMVYFAGTTLEKIAKNSWKLAIVILVAYIINFALFVPYYFTEFVEKDLELFEQDIMDATNRAEQLNKETVYVENCLNQTYIYTLVVNQISPYDFNKNLEIYDGCVVRYNNYKFELPEEVEENSVYLIKNDENKINQLLENDFKLEEYGEFKVLYKTLR